MDGTGLNVFLMTEVVNSLQCLGSIVLARYYEHIASVILVDK
jgi:hypothetical protein